MGLEDENNAIEEIIKPPTLPEDYALNGLTVQFDEKSRQWLVVNTDGSKLRPRYAEWQELKVYP